MSAPTARPPWAWLREQPWFTGELATIGPSYLGYVQFALENVLVATAATLGFERGMAAVIRAGLRVQRRMRRVSRDLPLIRAYPPALGGRVPWLEDWLTHPGRDDPYWAGLQIPPGAMAPVPVSLLTGWWDACLDPVLEEYGRLRAASRPGPGLGQGIRPLRPAV